jgi:hypothetical protein
MLAALNGGHRISLLFGWPHGPSLCRLKKGIIAHYGHRATLDYPQRGTVYPDLQSADDLPAMVIKLLLKKDIYQNADTS